MVLSLLLAEDNTVFARARVLSGLKKKLKAFFSCRCMNQFCDIKLCLLSIGALLCLTPPPSPHLSLYLSISLSLFLSLSLSLRNITTELAIITLLADYPLKLFPYQSCYWSVHFSDQLENWT